MNFNRILFKIKDRYQKFAEYPLTKKAPILAMFRYIKFNVIQFLAPKERIYPWVNGLRFYAKKGEAGIVPNIYFKLFDYEDSMFMLDSIQQGDLFVDVGANVGHFSMLAASKKAEVISIEPIPDTYQRLCKNIRLNQFESLVTCENLGIGKEVGELKFTSSKDVMNSVALDTDTNCITVPVTSLNTLLKDKNPKMIKIDVEGYEYFVLEGATEVLQKESLQFLLIELNESSLKFKISSDQIHEFILSFGFVPALYDVEHKKLQEQSSFNTHSFNTLYVKK